MGKTKLPEFKRIFDFIVSLVLLILLCPLFLIVGLIIKVTSPGPVFFIQQRVGLNRKIFNIYKFRTMVKDAEKKLHDLEVLNEVSGSVFKIKNDPRITCTGKFLRRTSIDELPQLFNVLKGEMSLVGPRPLPVRDYNSNGQGWQHRRFEVYPGITCLWQINGRSEVPFQKWMDLDLKYINNQSFILDMQILARTIPAIIRKHGAY